MDAASAGATARLTHAEIERYRADGFLSPVDALSASEAADYRRRLVDLIAATSPRLTPELRYKPHLFLTWVSELVHHPAVVEPVRDLLGPDLLAWRVTFFIKPGGDPGYVAWHQDSRYWGLTPADVATAWIALTPTTKTNGCLRVIAGSHLEEVPHETRLDRDNQLLHGQAAAVDFADDRITDLELERGQMSIHHVGLLHGSNANRTDDLRAGLAVRYIAPHVRGARRDSATLVSGEDRHGHYDLEPRPRFDRDPLTMQWHRRAVRRYALAVAWNLVRRPNRDAFVSAARLAFRPQALRVALGLLRRER